jgi:hypothetical protein
VVIGRLAGICFSLLLAAVAIYVAVRLVESVASALIVIAAVIGGITICGFLARLWWRRHLDRW